ncbi:MAG: aminotransferase class I/II-fold pyridoxal phosphate-dependent enzyme [Bacteroidales bacterium]|nr:aminotransferase class I/II-fold pyridoxal phosphate-dependent enzyme [Bacteroidales bacterium]MCF8397002.1 aminotransferase class I/II-fold pyridoxal phosphate-dependent enzyme [Bacteroidales bacterium]
MKKDPATRIQMLEQFGEFGGVNPSVTDSATYTFMQAKTMLETFTGEAEGCFLYSRHWNPSNKFLADAIAAMEDTEAAWVTASGMSAISNAIMGICKADDHIVSSVTTYGGTFALLNNYLPKFNIETTFVNITDLDAVEKAIRPNTKILYTESVTNPLLQISDIPRLAEIAKKHGIKLMVDNTFTPMIIEPAKLGADVVVYSLTKFVNGKNDCVAGAIAADAEFISSLIDVNDGTSMLLGPVLDPMRSSQILKNMHTLHIRMKQHSENASYLAAKLDELGLKVVYPGFDTHPGHELMSSMMNEKYGYGGMLTIDMETSERAAKLMECMEEKGAGYLAVSLGYFKTLFSNSGKSTSSEVPEETQKEMGMSEGLIRFSVGLDNEIENTFEMIKACLEELKFL